MPYKVVIEGQEIPVPDEIGADDAKVKQALAPFYPDASNAMITRTEKDGVMVINVVKRAGTKGGHGALGHLQACAGGMNPAVALYLEFQGGNPLEGDPETMVSLSGRVDAAIKAGEAQGQAVDKAKKRLQTARAIPAPVVVEGF